MNAVDAHIPPPHDDATVGPGAPVPVLATCLGRLYAADCMAVLPHVADASVDTVFADPPFNIGKAYGPSVDDRMTERAYLDWCKSWLRECVRVLVPGGSLFLYNLPAWNIRLGAYLMDELGMTFRHDVAIGMKASFPIAGKLYPAHYSMLYLTKGQRPRTFRRIRTPIETCRHCKGEIKDYGGYRDRMKESGVTLTDMWTDIPVVRHAKYKSSERAANALSTKILDRVVEMSTVPGDLVLDPFGGSGTTYAVCEAKGRRWIGTEIDFADAIAKRLTTGDVLPHPNQDVVDP